ncbi:MAG: Restriction modification methylase [Promethearchaeota archaeon]|nr:MAG: Restriction modification methylase [Candidatus Lokiarchaeota archaeon]
MVREIFSYYLKNLLKTKKSNTTPFKIEELNILLSKDPSLKAQLKKHLKSVKILDPCCGSGRFLVSTAEFLFNLYKTVEKKLTNYELKKMIIEKHIFGIEKEREACQISKIALYQWLISDIEKPQDFEFSARVTKSRFVETLIKDSVMKFNIINSEFLLEYHSERIFDVIIGNPPYIENKKITDREYKKKLYDSFETAYKLFDISILFIEKGLHILKKNTGFLSYIITNKFLSADYGLKTRRMLIDETQIRRIVNISALSVFKNRSTYPIIILLKNKNPNSSNWIEVKKIDTLQKIKNQNKGAKEQFLQKFLHLLPKRVIPMEGNISLLVKVFERYKSIKETFKDLKIIYRPYGFKDYAKYFDSTIKNPEMENHIGILLGTGNLGRFHIKFNKQIRIAKRTLKVSYFKFPQNYKLSLLTGEKLMFREIAKKLTFAYDPGIFTNVTGLYFVSIPSLTTEELFCLLTIFNSEFMDMLFKNLYMSLHMSRGYLRINGSFVETLPMPPSLPKSLSQLGKVLQILTQYRYDFIHNKRVKKYCPQKDIEESINFLEILSNQLTQFLYLSELKNQYKHDFPELYELLISDNLFPTFEYKYTYPYFKFSKFKVSSENEFVAKLVIIRNQIKNLKKNSRLIEQMNKFKKILEKIRFQQF